MTEHIDRRRFIASAAAAGACSTLPVTSASALGASQEGFRAAVAADPRFLGWKTPDSDRLDCPSLVIEGEMPKGLRGTFWRNGPTAHTRHGLRYGHWFDGDGMIQEFRFTDAGVSHRGRMIATPKLQREDAAGRRLYDAFGTAIDSGARVRSADDVNSANISVLDFNGELMALWESGSASLLDRDTLQWDGFKNWGHGLRGLPFTAHPKVAPDGSLWAFGYALFPRTALVLYHIAPDGELVKAAVVPLDALGMVHDFVLTERSLVIVIPPYVHEHADEGTILDGHVWRPELGTRVLIVSREDFESRRWVQLPAGFGFHHGNGWEDQDGTVRFDYCVAENPGIVETTMRGFMEGEFRSSAAEHYAEVTIHADGRARVEQTDEVAEFPQIDPRIVGHRNRYLYTLGAEGLDFGLLRSVVKRDIERGQQESFDLGPGFLAEEQVFVPFPDGTAEDEGWLVGTFLAYDRAASGVAVFDARRVSDGPVATALLPYPLPLGFHGRFSAA